MNGVNRRTQSTYAKPEIVDLWESYEAPMRPVRRRRRSHRLNITLGGMAMLILAAVVVLGSVLGYIYQTSVITSLTKEKQALEQQLDKMRSDLGYTNWQIDQLSDLGRIRREATDRLGMVEPDEEHKKSVYIFGTSENVVTANAGAEEEGVDNTAP